MAVQAAIIYIGNIYIEHQNLQRIDALGENLKILQSENAQYAEEINALFFIAKELGNLFKQILITPITIENIAPTNKFNVNFNSFQTNLNTFALAVEPCLIN